MYKKIAFGLLVFLVSYLLLRNKDSSSHQKEELANESIENSLVVKLLETAHSYENTPYKFGGETVAGMDCSGLVFTSYKSLNITLPRTSMNMSFQGEEVLLGEVKQGDLLFFDTDKLDSIEKVNHVGMITSIDEGVIYFIHSTSKKGVIISSIKESYWEKAFLKARRILI